MTLDELQLVAVSIRQEIAAFEAATYGAEWTTADLLNGLLTDVGDLAAAVQRVEGRRPHSPGLDPVAELRHELGDCLWVLLVLSDRFGIDLESAFAETMTSIRHWLESVSE